MVIDTSGSMAEEIISAQSYLNSGLMNVLDAKGIDYQFMLLAADFKQYIIDWPIVVPPALSLNPRFHHINQKVHSELPFSEIVQHWNDYKGFMRDPSIFNIIVITDDSDSVTFANFKTQMGGAGIDRDDFILHGIVGLSASPLIDGIGQQVMDGIAATIGVQCDILTPFTQWGSLFDQIAQNIIQNVNSTFYLKEDALSYGFHIYINNVEQIGNFSFNARNNSVTLIGVTFTAGDVLKIVYNTPVSGN
jgi:hypothetical protein